MCFVFAVLTILHPANGFYRGRASSYREHMCKYMFPKTFPRNLSTGRGVFERKNCVSVNVFGYDSEKNFVYPLKVVDDELEHHVDLLLVENHFVGVTNFARLFSNAKSLRFRCKRCLTGFQRQETPSDHLSMCRDKKPGKTVFPNKGDELYTLSEHAYHGRVPLFIAFTTLKRFWNQLSRRAMFLRESRPQLFLSSRHPLERFVHC
uniref:Putative secreted protein n=1 Tax=Ixodes ricinus TaxID=34613 RepID=A0A6B0V469_IXORI